MRAFHRALATSVATLAIAAAGLAVASPAAATPEDGKGCVGSRTYPETYVCVISTTPENVVPTTTTTNVPVTVPELCYFLDCTEPETVVVPVPGVTPRTGVVATLWYRGQYIPINVGTGEATALLYKSIDLATATVNGAVVTAGQTVAYAATLANGAAGTAYALATNTAAAALVTVNNAVADVNARVAALRATADSEVAKAIVTVNNAIANANATVNGAVATVNRELAEALADADAAVANAIRIANNTIALVNREVANALVTLDAAVDAAYAEAMATVNYVYDVVRNLPTADELIAYVWATIDQALEPYRPLVQELYERIEYYINEPGVLIERVLNNPTVQKVLRIADDLVLPCVDYYCFELS